MIIETFGVQTLGNALTSRIPSPQPRRKDNMFEPLTSIQTLRVKERSLEVLVLGVNLAHFIRKTQLLRPSPPRYLVVDLRLQRGALGVQLAGLDQQTSNRLVKLCQATLERGWVTDRCVVDDGAAEGKELLRGGRGHQARLRGEREGELVLYLSDIAVKGLSISRRLKRDEGLVCQLGSKKAENLRHCAVVDEPRVAILGHPVERVVVAVIVVDRISGASAEAQIDARNASIVLEGREVTATSHGADLLVPKVIHSLALDSLVWRLNLRCDIVEQAVQKWCGGSVEHGAAHAHVHIEVGDIGVREPREVFLDPLGGAEEAVLLTVPGCEDNGTKWFPTLLQSFPEATDDLVDDG